MFKSLSFFVYVCGGGEERERGERERDENIIFTSMLYSRQKEKYQKLVTNLGNEERPFWRLGR